MRVEIKDKTNYILTDHIQSARLALAEDNTVSEPIDYTPFGDSRISGESDVIGYYTGQVFEPESATYDYHARGYDPSVARFLSLDSQREAASPYVYVGNNPIFFVDFTGAGKFPFILISGAAQGERKLEHRAAIDIFNILTSNAIIEGEGKRVFFADKFFGYSTNEKTGKRKPRHSFSVIKNILQRISGGHNIEYDNRLFWLASDKKPGLNRRFQYCERTVKQFAYSRWAKRFCSRCYHH